MPKGNTLMLPDEYRVMYDVEDNYWWYRALRLWIGQVLAHYAAPGGRWLDAGCGTGTTLSFLRARGFRGVGVDRSAEALHLATTRPGLKGTLAQASVDALPFPRATFDGVISVDVLYLLPDAAERRSLAEFRRVLKPGGILVLHLPAYDWLWGEHDQAVSTQRRYTAALVRERLETAGFELVKLEYRYLAALPAMFALRRVLRRRKATAATAKSDLTVSVGPLNGVLEWLAGLEERLGRRWRRPIGTSVCAVARVPDQDRSR